MAFTNCLLERVNLELVDEGANLDYYAYNNLFRVGTLQLDREGSGTWQLKDNLFDQTTIYLESGAVTHDYNGYVTNKVRITPNATNDVILANNPVYQASYLGNYYYPTNDGNLSRLIDAGSRTAFAAGLGNYTTQTNQLPDTGTVDIGFHFATFLDLTAQCRSNRIVLFWEVPDWAGQAFEITGFNVYRATASGGVYGALATVTNSSAM